MTAARQYLADALKAALPEFAVIPWLRTVDGVAKPTLIVTREHVAHATSAKGVRDNAMKVLVVDPRQTNGEDQLDASLDVVLAALDVMPDIAWTDATRAVLDEKWPTYSITLTLTTTED